MSFTQLMRVSMKIAFIGEAVSGFGGMETVIRDVITTFRQQHIYSEMFFFVVMIKWIRDGWKVLSTRVHFPIFA